MDHLSQALDQAIVFHRSGNLAAAEDRYLQVLEVRADHFDALQMLGFLRYEQGRFLDALSLIGAALKTNPNSPSGLLNYAVVLDALGRREEALAYYDKALAIEPDYAQALFNRGIALRYLKRPAEAIASFEGVLALRPDDADAHDNRGNALRDIKRPAEALAGYDKALAIKPHDAEFLNHRGNALRDLNRTAEALASYDRALAIRPDHVEALNNRGSALRSLNRPTEALVSYDRALAINPKDAGALYNRGNVLQDLDRPFESLASYDQALALKPNYVGALNNRGSVLQKLKRSADALAGFDAALAVQPHNIEALNNRGGALLDLKRPAEALASYDKALAIKPDYSEAIYNRGITLRDLKRPAEALASFEKALAIEPDHRYAFGGLADAALAICDWPRTAVLAGELELHIAQRRSIISPFTLLGYGDNQPLQLECARQHIADKVPVRPPPLWSGATYRHDKIRIAYLSADFYRHATAFLMAELFELHDRARFEVIGISFGHDDQSDMRARLVRAFDQFHDVRQMSDLDAARLLNDLQVDIAVDLKGYTQDARSGILAHRPAPIQVSYLGYPGTMGTDLIDYIIADRTVLPFDQQPFYAEKIVHIPDCYQVNDSKREIAAGTPTRGEVGLPDQGFVFCCFNNNYKITPSVFDIWMRLMSEVACSVLWLLQDNADAERNLRQEAAARGIDPDRLVFAPRMEAPEHLARHRLADLFLDTLPYNAHTTASDALWAGLPVLTCRGASFPGRVATSLLDAAGLPELVTNDLREYEALARRLATEAELLQGFRHRLAENRETSPLFDADRIRRHIETAYATMWKIQQRGEKPRSFSVERKDSDQPAAN